MNLYRYRYRDLLLKKNASLWSLLREHPQDISLGYGSLLLPLPSRKTNLNCWQSMFGKEKLIQKSAPGSYLPPKKNIWPKNCQRVLTTFQPSPRQTKNRHKQPVNTRQLGRTYNRYTTKKNLSKFQPMK